MDKLPSKKFDKYYEECKNGRLKDREYFECYVRIHNKDLWRSLLVAERSLSEDDEAMMEAYRTGEIRDRGAMTTRVRVLVGWEKGTEVDVVDYKFPSGESGWKAAVPDADGDYVVRSKTSCEIVTDEPRPRVFLVDGHAQFGCTPIPHIEPEYPWYQLDPAVFDGLVGDPPSPWGLRAELVCINDRLHDVIASWSTTDEQDDEIIISLYKAGILRQGGPLEVYETCGQQLPDRD